MPQALITINAVVGSDTDLPINTLVQLDNTNSGGELTYTWTILDQPPGTVDVLSSVSVQNPTFTPKKEGTYLIRLIVNQGMASEQEDRVVAAVVQLKTLERIPAAGETTEGDSSDGWATAMNAYMRRIDTLLGDPGIFVGVNASGGTLSRGNVLRATASSTIKSGLPGQEVVPGFSKALANTLAQVDEPLVVCEGTLSGGSSVANGALMKVRFLGRYAGNTGGVAAVGDPVYVSDTGTMSLTAGTVRRKVGSAMTAGATYDVWFAGMGGEDITPIDRVYVVHGPPGTLTNAIRVDGGNATGLTTPFRVKAGDAATVPFQVQGFLAGTDMQQWLNSGGSTLARMTNAGDLEFVGRNVLIGVTTNNTLGFLTNNVERWRVAATGELQAQGADRAIQNVLNPVNAQDAATRNYNEQFTARSIPPRNFVLNSDMRFWQRGTAAVALTTGRVYRADRWYAFADAGAGLNSTNSRLVAGGVNYNQIERVVGETHVGAKYLVQEIEYEDVTHLVAANNNSVAASELPITLQISVANGIANTAGSIVIEVRSGTSGIYATGYVGDTLLATQTAAALAGTYVLEIPPGTIPTTATRIAVIMKWTQTGVAVANQAAIITNVQLCIGRPAGPAGTSPTNIIPAPNYAGGSFQGELARLQRYYEKSYDVDTVPATLTVVGQQLASADANTVIEQMVQFRVTKRVAPTLTFYNPGAANANWVHAGGATGINPINISTRNFDPDFTGAPDAVAAGTFIRGHWAADAEI